MKNYRKYIGWEYAAITIRFSIPSRLGAPIEWQMAEEVMDMGDMCGYWGARCGIFYRIVLDFFQNLLIKCVGVWSAKCKIFYKIFFEFLQKESLM